MRKLIIVILLAGAAAFGGIKLYFWYTLTNFADTMVVALRPVAHISYDGTISTLSGKLGLKDIEIRPMGYDTTITIDAITLQADNLWQLYTISSTIQDGKMPNHIGLNIVGIEIDADSRLFQNVISAPGLWGITQLPFGALNCGNRTQFSGNDLSMMAVQTISASFHTGYQFNPGTQIVSFYLKGTAPGFNKISVRTDYDAGSTILSPQVLRNQDQLSVTGAQFSFTDLGWHAKLRKFCAAQTGVSEDAYVIGHADAVWQALNEKGIIAGKDVKAAYMSFLQDNSNLTITLDMARAIKLKNLGFYAPEDILYYLNPTLLVNGEMVSLAGIKAGENFSRSSMRQYRQQLVKKQAQDYTFAIIPVNQLSRHIGEVVRLKTSGRTFEGKLKKMEERIARLQISSYNGKREEIVLLIAIESAAVGKIVEKTAASQKLINKKTNNQEN